MMRSSKIKPIFNELHEKYDSSHGDFFRMEMNKHIIPLNERQIELIKEIIPEIEKNK